MIGLRSYTLPTPQPHLLTRSFSTSSTTPPRSSTVLTRTSSSSNLNQTKNRAHIKGTPAYKSKYKLYNSDDHKNWFGKTFKKMDKEWEAIQHKTFTKWVNIQLSTKNHPPVEDLYPGLADGTALIRLLESLTDSSIGKYHINPKFRLQKIENLNKALQFIRSHNIQLTNIGAEDIVDGNRKLTLGMIWTIVLRYTIDDINEEGLGAKEGLLLWCQRKTAGYEGVNVSDFTYSWKDGLALCALIHRHYPELLPYEQLNKADMRANTELAFQIAERELGIPQLLDVADLCDISKPDELSVMTYIASYFHAFSEMDRHGTAGRRVIKFVELMQNSYEASNDYEARAQQLIKEMNEIQSSWSTKRPLTHLPDIQNHLDEFKDYKLSTKRRWLKEKHELDILLGNVQTKLRTYGLKPYFPPKGLGLKDLDKFWNELTLAESKRRKCLYDLLKDLKQGLSLNYIDLADKLGLELNKISGKLAELSGDLNDQSQIIKTLLTKVPQLDALMNKVIEADLQCKKAGILEVEECDYQVDELNYDLDLIKLQLDKKMTFIDNQMVAQTMTNLTPDQLEEFEASFKHFDLDLSNTLTISEFQACLAALGHAYPDEEFQDLFYYVSDGNEEVTFEQYLTFMIQSAEDKMAVPQLLEAFEIVADTKPYVTELDLKKQALPPKIIEFLIKTMPEASDLSPEEIEAAQRCNEGLVLDFNYYLNNLFDSS